MKDNHLQLYYQQECSLVDWQHEWWIVHSIHDWPDVHEVSSSHCSHFLGNHHSLHRWRYSSACRHKYQVSLQSPRFFSTAQSRSHPASVACCDYDFSHEEHWRSLSAIGFVLCKAWHLSPFSIPLCRCRKLYQLLSQEDDHLTPGKRRGRRSL